MPNTTIASAAVNSDFSDIATALTQSIASTGVTPISGSLLHASGNVSAPGISWASAQGTGFFLAGTNQIGWAANGVQGATFNADTTVTWQNGQTIATGGLTVTAGGLTVSAGTSTFGGPILFNTSSFTFGGGVGGFYTGLAPAVSVGMIIDGGGSVLTTGQKGQIYIPFPMTITNWWVMADQSGSVTIDVLRANNAVPSSSIVGAGTKPNLSSSQFTTSAPSSWTATTLAANDFVAFSVSAPSSVQRVGVYLSGLRTG